MMRRSTSASASSSAMRFASTWSSSGYLRRGKEACGQSKAGISTLWIGFDRVVESEPNRRPWNPVLKLKMDNWGAPGAWLIIEEESSSAVNSTCAPPRSCWRRHMKAAL